MPLHDRRNPRREFPTMIHPLWETKAWETATLDEVVSALFNPPPFLNPFDVGKINRFHPTAKGVYLNLFYEGNIPNSVKKINKVN